jgi:hypothetical protein
MISAFTPKIFIVHIIYIRFSKTVISSEVPVDRDEAEKSL